MQKKFLVFISALLFVLSSIINVNANTDLDVNENIKTKVYSAMILTEFGKEMPLITHMNTILKDEAFIRPLSNFSLEYLSANLHKYCQKKGFQSTLNISNTKDIAYIEFNCNILDSINKDLKQLNLFNLYIPKYKLETKSNDKEKKTSRIMTQNLSQLTPVKIYFEKERQKLDVLPDLTLLEKEKFPILIFIKNYNSKLIHKGKEKVETITIFEREGEFEGIVTIQVNFLIELLKSKNLETIDRIEFKKDYESKPFYFKGKNTYKGLVGGVTIQILNDNRKDVIVELLDQYYNDILQFFKNYDWETAFKIAIK